MFMPSIFRENLFDDWMDFPFQRMERVQSGNTQNVMRTDVKETDQQYEIDMDLPGFKKEDVKVQLKDGYLTVQAAQNMDNSQQDQNGKYIRRERFYGSVGRSFYVGDKVTEEDIHAKFEDGILKLTLPKDDAGKAEQKQYIAIEG